MERLRRTMYSRVPAWRVSARAADSVVSVRVSPLVFPGLCNCIMYQHSIIEVRTTRLTAPAFNIRRPRPMRVQPAATIIRLARTPAHQSSAHTAHTVADHEVHTATMMHTSNSANARANCDEPTVSPGHSSAASPMTIVDSGRALPSACAQYRAPLPCTPASPLGRWGGYSAVDRTFKAPGRRLHGLGNWRQGKYGEEGMASTLRLEGGDCTVRVGEDALIHIRHVYPLRTLCPHIVQPLAPCDRLKVL